MDQNKESLVTRLARILVRPVEPVGDFYERLAIATAASAPARERVCAGGACA